MKDLIKALEKIADYGTSDDCDKSPMNPVEVEFDRVINIAREALSKHQSEGFCEWVCTDSDIGLYDGSCGASWIFEIYPTHNYCPECGKPIHLSQPKTEGGK